jgi:hypothetical protein
VIRLALLAILLWGGCALVSMNGMNGVAKSEPPTVYPVCSDQVAPWIFDALLATAAGLATASAVSEREPGVAVGIGAGGAVLVASAVYGIVTSSRCRSARAQYAPTQPAYRIDPSEPVRGPPR